MPLEQLMALYGHGPPGPGKLDKCEVTSSTQADISCNNSNYSYLDETLPLTSQDSQCNVPSTTTRSSNRQFEELPAHWSLPQSSSMTNTNLMLNSPNDGSDLEDDEDDDLSDAEAVDDWRRTIQVGSDYQASILEGLCEYGDVPPYENEDKLLWDPTILSDEIVVQYLRQIAHIDVLESLDSATDMNGSPGGNNGTLEINTPTSISEKNLPPNCHIRDDEQALYLLHQCGHNMDEALRRRKLQQNNIFEPMSSWSEEECKNFEEGIKLYGKDFHLIQKNKVR